MKNTIWLQDEMNHGQDNEMKLQPSYSEYISQRMVIGREFTAISKHYHNMVILSVKCPLCPNFFVFVQYSNLKKIVVSVLGLHDRDLL